MSNTTEVRLRHVTFTTSGKVFLPDGRAVQSDHGVVAIPVSRPLAILAAWYDGYRIDVRTDEEIRSVEAFIESVQGLADLPAVPAEPEPEPEPSEDETSDEEPEDEPTPDEPAPEE